MSLGKTPYQIFRDNAWVFIGQFALWFAGLVALFAVLGLVPDSFMGAVPGEQLVKDTYSNFVSWVSGGPESDDDGKTRLVTDEDSIPVVNKESITRIRATSVGINAPIMHPVSTDVTMLDNALKNGAVYYPGSGTPNAGNIFIFGHSTNWAIVQNQAYKTFNNLDKLKVGEEIFLDTDTVSFVYRVDSVRLVDADEAFVNFDSNTPKLTISTCNTFGEKQERHVVEATLVATMQRN